VGARGGSSSLLTIVVSVEVVKRPLVATALAVALGIGCVVVGPGVSGQARASLLRVQEGSTCGSWTVMSVGLLGSLSSVATLSPSEAWAVGDQQPAGSEEYKPIAEHWNGTASRVIPTAPLSSTDAVLGSVVELSATNVWAVGFFANSKTFRSLVEHWNGHNWSVVPSPNSGSGENILMGLAATSATDMWAVGTGQATPSSARRTLVEHWNGHDWLVVRSPNSGSGDNLLQGVSVNSRTDAWAVGDDRVSYGSTLALHWNGRTWAIVKTVNPGAGERFLFGVAARFKTQVLAVGSDLIAGGHTRALAERWNGSAWVQTPAPSPDADLDELHAVTATSSTNAWAVGYRRPTPSALFRTLVEHWNGSRWSLAASPNPSSREDDLSGVAAIPGTGKFVAVGYAGGRTLVESYCPKATP
jgi:hypothetical protein